MNFIQLFSRVIIGIDIQKGGHTYTNRQAEKNTCLKIICICITDISNQEQAKKQLKFSEFNTTAAR